MTTQIAPPGLKGLAVSDTELGSVRGEEGFFHYRQYDAVQLARTRTLEEVWTLQVEGALPRLLAYSLPEKHAKEVDLPAQRARYARALCLDVKPRKLHGVSAS